MNNFISNIIKLVNIINTLSEQYKSQTRNKQIDKQVLSIGPKINRGFVALYI